MTALAADRAMRELAEDRGESLDRRLAALRYLRDHATSGAVRERAGRELYRLDPVLMLPLTVEQAEELVELGELQSVPLPPAEARLVARLREVLPHVSGTFRLSYTRHEAEELAAEFRQLRHLTPAERRLDCELSRRLRERDRELDAVPLVRCERPGCTASYAADDFCGACGA